jgi:hypothetical protein
MSDYEKYYKNKCQCGELKYKYSESCNICKKKKFTGKGNPMYGRKHKQSTKLIISKRLTGKNTGKRAVGPAKNDKAGRQRAQKWFKSKPCDVCGKEKTDRHHIDGNPKNNEESNIRFLCRRHHQELDGRMKLLKHFGEKHIQPRSIGEKRLCQQVMF